MSLAKKIKVRIIMLATYFIMSVIGYCLLDTVYKT